MATSTFNPATISLWRRVLWSMAALAIVAPAVAMQFTDEVKWGIEDFSALALLLAVAGGIVEIGVRFSRRRAFVIGLLLVVGAAFVLAWAQLAVGVF